jgi:hypothetical protein
LKLNIASLALLSLLLLALTITVGTVNVQAQNSFTVTVKPTNDDSPFYTSVGNNWTLSFTANWNSGEAIQNATAAIDIKNSQNSVIETLKFNTTSGVFTFNYSSAEADILTFTPTSLTTMDGQEYKTDDANLEVGSTVVWYDTFNVALVSYNVNNLGKTVVTVNVTYKLLPEEGLTLPNQTFLPKIVHTANVTINGAVATETSQGIFTAESSASMDTAYVNVRVSQDGWKTTDTAFSFPHTANQQVWMYGVAFVSIGIFAAFAVHYAVYRKASSSQLKHSNKSFFGFILLIVTSVLSLYWGAVAIEGVMHTFDWFMFTVACMFSFGFGIIGAILVLRKKLQPLAIFAPIIPLLINTIIVKSALDSYQLANPWLMLFASTVLSAVCIFFVAGSDEAFKKPQQAL